MPDADIVKGILSNHRTEIPASTDAERDIKLNELAKKIDAAFTVAPEDRRLSVQIMTDVSKVFITMALAAIVALGALVQLGWTSFVRDKSAVLWLCFAAGTACFVSMWFGVRALRDFAKSGVVDQNRWSLDDRRRLLNGQAITGIVAIALFISAIGTSLSAATTTTGIVVTIPNAVTATLPGDVVVRGVWTQLSLEAPGGSKLDLPQAQAQAQSFAIRSGK